MRHRLVYAFVVVVCLSGIAAPPAHAGAALALTSVAPSAVGEPTGTASGHPYVMLDLEGSGLAAGDTVSVPAQPQIRFSKSVADGSGGIDVNVGDSGFVGTYDVAVSNGTDTATCAQCLTFALKPDAPTITLIQPGKTSVELRWIQEDSFPATITQYDVTWADSNGIVGSTTVPPASPANSTTSATVDGLTAGTAYTFTVAADTGQVQSNPTVFVEAVGVVPTTPTVTGYTPEVFASQLHISDSNYWTLPSEVSYDTRVTTPSGAHFATAGDSFPEILNVHQPGVYTVEVRAHNSVGASAWSAPAEARIITVPGPVRDLHASDFGSPVTLTWTPPKHDNGAPVTDYRVEVLTPSGHFDEVVHPRTTSLTIGSLRAGHAFIWRVDAENVASQNPPHGTIYGSLVDGEGFSTDRLGITALDAKGRGWWRGGDGQWHRLGAQQLTRAPAAVLVRGRWMFIGSTRASSVLVRELHTPWHRLVGSACGSATAATQRGRLWVVCRTADRLDQRSARVSPHSLPTTLADDYNQSDATPAIAGRPDAVRETGDQVDYLFAQRTASGIREGLELPDSVSTSDAPALSCDGPLAVASLHSPYYDNSGFATACRRSRTTVSWRVAGEDKALNKRGVTHLPFAVRGFVAVCDPGGRVQLILERGPGRLTRYDVATGTWKVIPSPTTLIDLTAVVVPH